MSDTDLMTSDGHALTHILEAALLAADEPLSQARLASLFPEDTRPSNQAIGKALEAIAEACEDRGVELREVASGFRLQVKNDLQPWVARLWTEKPQKYSRAMLETLALIAYRQPITRGEIESVRGVSLSSNLIRSLQEREWIRIVGHRDVPGKPALFGTTKVFLDYFNLKSLDELPTLAEIKDMDTLEPELEFDGDAAAGPDVGEEPATTAAQAVAGDESATDSEADGESPEPLNAMDDEAEDDDLDEAFAELDTAFVTADSIDLGEDDPEPDAGVDPDSPQGDLVADSKDQTGPS
jgi:segregation and condensation protein B